MTAIMAMMSTGCGRQNGQTETPLPAQAASAQAVTAEDIEKVTAEDIEKETAEDSEEETAEDSEKETAEDSEKETGGAENIMRLLIGETEVPVAWEKNASVNALQDLCPLTIQMSMYCGFEQVGSIGQNIVREDQQTDTDSGDIVLYSGNQIVIFYGSNSWAYTRLGHIDLTEQEMRDLLSGGDVSITLQ